MPGKIDTPSVLRALTEELEKLESVLRRELFTRKSIEIKPDSSLLTEADTRIEAALTAKLAEIFPRAAMLGEESAPLSREEAAELLSSDYLWAVDPIDGTANFAFGLPHFAISVGLLERESLGLRPVLGAILAVGSSEIVSSDGAALHRRCLRSGETLKVEPGLNGPISHAPVMYSRVPAPGSPLTRNMKRLRTLGSTVLDIVYCALGSGIGAVTQSNLWDFAGSFPIAQAAGVEMRSLADGKLKTHFGIEDFRIPGDRRDWRLTSPHLFCRPEHLGHVTALLGLEIPPTG